MKPSFVKTENATNLPQTNNEVQPNPPQVHRPKLLSAFISKFLNREFIEKIVNVSVYHVDYKTTAKAGKNANSTSVIRKFIIDCFKDVDKMKTLALGYPVKAVKEWLLLAKEVIDLKSDVNNRLINYDNLDQHFNKGFNIPKLISNVKANRITSLEEFREMHDSILETIQVRNELRVLEGTILDIDSLAERVQESDESLLTLTKYFKEYVLDAYSGISQLSLVNKVSNLSDYIMISDENSIKDVAKNLTTYLATGYSFYKSGFNIIDSTIGGIESSNVHIICGPTNNAKSIFMINLFWQMILNNIQDFEESDCFIFYTLEDDIYKLMGRFISIFGNYNSAAIKHLLVRASTLFKRQKNKDINENNALYNKVCKIFEDILKDAILKTTGKRVTVFLKHSRENTTPRDIVRFMDARKTEGQNVRALFIDYLDIMVPSDSKYTDYNDYNSHGVITQELRNIAGEYGIPVITITQGKRDSEGSAAMTNADMGDSYKKARYSDYIYMVRLRYDYTLLSECVRKDIIPKGSEDDNNLTDLNNPNSSTLVPFEIKITKAKNAGKNLLQYHIFSGANLRIYEMLSNFYNHVSNMQAQSQALASSVDVLSIDSMDAVPNNGKNLLI